MALSLGSPRAGVTRRLFTVEPGLSSTGDKASSGPAATARPSGGGVMRSRGRAVNREMRAGSVCARLWAMATAAHDNQSDLANETPETRARRLAWERARLAEADADFAAGRYISGDEAMQWLENEIAEAEAAAEREAD